MPKRPPQRRPPARLSKRVRAGSTRRPTRTLKQRRTPADGAQLSPAALETRNRLLEAAEGEFARNGYGGARLDRIAETVGVKTPLIHHYFNGKSALYRAVVLRAVDTLTQATAAALTSFEGRLSSGVESDPAEGLRALAEALVRLTQRFYVNHEPILAILRQESRAVHVNTRSGFVASVRPIFDGLVAFVVDLQQRGVVVRELDARQLVLSFIAMAAFPSVEKLFIGGLRPSRPMTEEMIEARVHEITTLALHGMIARPN